VRDKFQTSCLLWSCTRACTLTPDVRSSVAGSSIAGEHRSRLILVSNDAAFYAGDKVGGSPHEHLVADARADGVELTPVSSIEACLKHLGRAASTFPRGPIESAVREQVVPLLRDALASWQMELPSGLSTTISAYLTERTEELVIQFEIATALALVAVPGSSEIQQASAFASGTAAYGMTDSSVREVRPDHVGLRRSDGQRLRANAFVYVAGSDGRFEQFKLERPLVLE